MNYLLILSEFFAIFYPEIFNLLKDFTISNKNTNQDNLLEKIVSLAKRRGFVFQSSEIYGGLNGCWDYGPLGVELLNNIKSEWWKTMTYREDVEGIDASIFNASESLGSFRSR